MGLVVRAEASPPAGDDAGPAWDVELRGRVGPFARSKRLRMVRTAHEPGRSVVFERREADRRQHGVWVLRCELDGHAGATDVTMRLHYGGGLWGPVLERVLAEEIERSKGRLVALVASER
jgi:hypothetical protein